MIQDMILYEVEDWADVDEVNDNWEYVVKF